MKYLSIEILFVCLLLVFLSAGDMVKAAGSATVQATATLQNVSVAVSDGSVSYGTMSAGASKSTIASDLNDLQTATNNGNVVQDLNIRGQNSANWTLAGSAGVDEYVHQFCISSCDTPPANYTALTTSNQTLASNVAASDNQTFNLRLTAPSSSTNFTQQNVDVTIQAVAH